MKQAIVCCVFLVCLVTFSWGQGVPGSHAPLLDTLGEYHRPVTTTSPLAQSYFDQGLRMIYGYYFTEAVASFREAIRLDPNCAMAYWGMALAIGPNPISRYFQLQDDPRGEGRKAIAKAVSLRQGASEKERAFIDALAKRYQLSNREQRDQAYMEAMQQLSHRYPDDPEAGTLYADSLMTMSPWTYWGADGKPYSPGTVEAAAALERVVEKFLQHPGANHFYIHLMENSQTPERALPHADRLAQLMPGLGHIVHMPGHIYIRVGQYEKAVLTNRGSVAADQEMVNIWGNHEFPADVPSGGPSHVSHPAHAKDFIHLAAILQGRYVLGMDTARELASAVPVEQLAGNGTAQARYVKSWLTLLRFGKWQEILERSAPSEGLPFVQGTWHFVRGSALAATGRLQEADAELNQVVARANNESVADLGVRVNTARTFLILASEMLAGQIAARRGEIERSLRHLETAVRMEDGFNYIEPPDWLLPVRHWLGAVLLEAGRPGEAEVVYWEDLRRNPENGWSLFGLLQSLRAQGKIQKATQVEERFKKAWARSDVQLTGSRF